MTDEIVPPHPRTVAFWVSRIFLGLLIVIVGLCGLKLAAITINAGTNRMLRDTGKEIDYDKAPKPPAPEVFDEAWLRKKRAEVAALDSEIQCAKEAWARQDASARSRTISREDDRKETSRLNQIVLDLERKRAEAAATLAEHDHQ